MVLVFRYKVIGADGEPRMMDDLITLTRAGDLGAHIIIGSGHEVPSDKVSDQGHYTPPNPKP